MRVGRHLPLAMIFAALLAAGCQSPPSAATKTPAPPEPPTRAMESVPVRDIDLARLDQEVRLLEWKVERTPARTTGVRAKIENQNAREALRMEVRALFRNEKGEVVGESRWTEITIPPGSTHQFAANTVLKKATDATLEFRVKEQPTSP